MGRDTNRSDLERTASTSRSTDNVRVMPYTGRYKEKTSPEEYKQ